MESPTFKNPSWLPLTVAILLAALFTVDLLTPRGLTEVILYSGIVYLAARSGQRSAVLLVAFASTVLTALGFVFSPPGASLAVSLSNRILSLIAIWITALLAVQRIKRDVALGEVETAHEQRERERGIMLQSILNSMGDGVIVVDDQGRFLLFNPAAEQILKIGPKEVPPDKWSEFYGLYLPDMVTPHPSEDLPLAKAIRGEAVTQAQIFVRHTKATEGIWLSTTARPLKDESGRIRGGVAVFRDITERKRMEETQLQLAAIVESSLDGIIAKKLDGTITSWNAAAERIYGYTAEEVKGRSVGILIPPDRPNELLQILGRIQRGLRIDQFETERVRKDGKRLHVSLTISPLKDASGRITGASTIVRDITDRKFAEEMLQQANNTLTERVKELERRTQEITLLSELAELLQACLTSEEAYVVIARIAHQLFPNEEGSLSIINQSRNLVETVAVWPVAISDEVAFQPSECWALRRGRVYHVEETQGGALCNHVAPPPPASSICLPMVAQGETLGLLHLRHPASKPPARINRPLATTLCEHLALALGNLKLRDALRTMSVRDSLTGLFNRRYMEESLEREVSRAVRGKKTVGIIMLDLDHFKRFNDSLGHDAGDAILREVGGFLERSMRKGDIACRYGGEEFVLILPEATQKATLNRANDLRTGIKNLRVQHRGETLGPITISLGVSLFPNHGNTGEIVLHQADAALYQAKAEGRDRVALAKPH